MKEMSELRPNKKLLDTNFSGYKLSLDSIPVYRHTVDEGVDRVSASDDQYSFLHVRVFSLHNHLFGDSWNDSCVYFIDKSWYVKKAAISCESARVDRLETVWQIPHVVERKPGHYNASIGFPSAEFAVITDGAGMLHILSRLLQPWQHVFSGDVLGQNSPFLIVACHQETNAVNKSKIIHCMLLHIEFTEGLYSEIKIVNQNNKTPNRVVTALDWVTLVEEEEGHWSVQSIRKLATSGVVEYIAFEEGNQHLYIASDASVKFLEDPVNPIIEPMEEAKVSDNPDEKVKSYSYQQSEDDIKLWFSLSDECTRNDVQITVTDLDIRVECKEKQLLSGKLFHVVEGDLTTWSIENNRLEIILIKRETGLMWQELIVGNKDGEELPDPAVVSEVHSRLAHLSSDKEITEAGDGCAPSFNMDQLEECDAFPTAMTVLSRVDVVTHQPTHQYILSGHTWLMTAQLNAEAVPAFCLRHDVDGCMWQLDAPTDESTWPCEHVATFLAFGYVLASKQDKKFTCCSPDMSYAVICETNSRVFVYRRSTAVNTDLRNRKTSTKVSKIARQQLINMESTSPILGIYAANQHLFVLTSDTFYTYCIE